MAAANSEPIRRRILPPMSDEAGMTSHSHWTRSEARGSTGGESSSSILNPVVQFKDILAKRGFVLTEVDVIAHNAHFIEPNEEKPVAVKVEADPNESDVRYVGTDFLALFAPVIGAKLTASRESGRRLNKYREREVNEVTLDGNVDEFDMLLRTLHPTQLPLQPGRMSIDHLVNIAQTSSRMHHIGTQYIQTAATFYLTLAMEVPTSDKFRLVSMNGDETLLTSTLVSQCGKAEEVNYVVTDPTFQEITRGAYANMLMAALLQHSARCDDAEYLRGLKKKNELLRDELLAKVKHNLDLSVIPDSWLDLKCGYCTVSIGDVTLHASVWCLRAWSPVFQTMLSSTWETTGNIMNIVISEVDMVSCEGVSLFLNLLHPTPKWALWTMLPEEVVAGLRTSSTLDSLFSILFDDADDLLNDVFRLAHKYQVGPLLELCVRLIESRSTYSLCDKFQMADSYHLPQLLARCLANMTTTRTFKRFIADEKEDFISTLSRPTLQVIIDRLVEIG